MTRDDLLAQFDEIVTDPRLRRDVVEARLADLRDDAYLLEEFHAFASGGASGRRGVFVYGWDDWTTCAAGILRWRAVWQRRQGSTVAGVVDLSWPWTPGRRPHAQHGERTRAVDGAGRWCTSAGCGGSAEQA